MKKTFLFSALALSAIGATAQQAIEQPSFCENWSIGVDGGVATPLVDHPFFGSMRGVFGLNVAKQITPTIGVGIEGQAAINTSSWYGPKSPTAIDATYVGAFGTVDLLNLFCGYQCATRPFTIAAIAGVGWGHQYYPKSMAPDNNYVGTRAGLQFIYNVNDKISVMLQPSVVYNLSGTKGGEAIASYDARRGAFSLLAGVTYHIGGHSFDCVTPLDPALVEALNGQVNALRAELQESEVANDAYKQKISDLQYALSQKPQVIQTQEVVTQVDNIYNSVRFVFFKIGSSVITADQMPNVEMIAQYMKNHPESTVMIKGYASKDGPEELNIKLAQARAESVKNALIKKYGIKASRIQAEGEGIGNMFEEESWNRVSICTLETNE